MSEEGFAELALHPHLDLTINLCSVPAKKVRCQSAPPPPPLPLEELRTFKQLLHARLHQLWYIVCSDGVSCQWLIAVRGIYLVIHPSLQHRTAISEVLQIPHL